jgi:hypothetical protein
VTLGADTPLSYEQGLLDALGIQLLYRHHRGQVTIFATITDATLHAIAALAAISENPDGTTPLDPRDQQAFSDLAQRPITRSIARDHGPEHDHGASPGRVRPARSSVIMSRTVITERRGAASRASAMIAESRRPGRAGEKGSP